MKKSKFKSNHLLKLARHVSNKYLMAALTNNKHSLNVSRTGANIDYLYWTTEDLPLLFDEWIPSADGPRLQGKEKLNTITALADYFNLNADELFHLFVPQYQDPIYMGMPLKDNCTCDEWLYNVYQFIKFKELETEGKQLQAVAKRDYVKPKIRKLKYKQFKNEEHEENHSMPKMCA